MANSADPNLKKPTDLDLHCLQRQDISRISRTRVKSEHVGCLFQPNINPLHAELKYYHTIFEDCYPIFSPTKGAYISCKHRTAKSAVVPSFRVKTNNNGIFFCV